MKIAGADPGLDGAIVILDSEGKLIESFVMPTFSVDKTVRTATKKRRRITKKKPTKKRATARIERYLDLPTLWNLFETKLKGKVDLFVLEKVHGVQGSGAASSFKFGTNYMALKAFAIASGIPLYEVLPQTWQKPFHKPGMKKLTAKERSMYFYKIYGKSKDIEFKNDHDGLVDAYLMSEWGRRNKAMIMREINATR
jgi:hypothetical protein